ncbi:hypothetical protein PF008_g2322 [Phytophthora fragariae]|uniref:Uncharacterized protein n=1 Tax=Phytophthora fragariae TaxID=53985 RepID=A0A6G0SI68_9STRA|nr:hypothetical protein PF008_g2322 [Phytophthora fragariae]
MPPGRMVLCIILVSRCYGPDILSDCLNAFVSPTNVVSMSSQIPMRESLRHL